MHLILLGLSLSAIHKVPTTSLSAPLQIIATRGHASKPSSFCLRQKYSKLNYSHAVCTQQNKIAKICMQVNKGSQGKQVRILTPILLGKKIYKIKS